MEKWKIPPGAAACCRRLRETGYLAFPVGGCVRDLFMGRTPGDWDITTSALPEEVMALFARTVPTGQKHGTVTVLLEGESLEVTTFRREEGYGDSRHPDRVRFDATLEEDLARRDFTMNAMALGPEGEIIDPFGGREDLVRGVIRCVGDPETRFGEDALRMLRAVRFSAQLGLEIAPEVRAAMAACAPLVGRVSAERVRVEVEKTVCSPCPQTGELFFTLGLLDPWVCRREVDLAGLAALPKKPLLRWAGFCARLKPEEGSGAFLTGLRLDGKTVRACHAGETICKTGLPDTPAAWRHNLAAWGEAGCLAAAAMAEVTGHPGTLAALEAVLAGHPPVAVEDLALTGRDLFELGLRGPDIGQTQRLLLERVLERPEDNVREILLPLVQV